MQEKGNGGFHWVVKPFIAHVNSDNEEMNDHCLVMRGAATQTAAATTTAAELAAASSLTKLAAATPTK